MLFYYKNDKKVLNKVLYNIKITIFVPSIPYEQIIIKARSKFMGYA